jgi:LysM repeat protein
MKLAIAVLILATCRIAHAQEAPNDTVVHRVKQGDSLELIAAELYGDRARAALIVVENKLVHPRPLKPGERLRLPVSREVTTSPGDTLEMLAGTYLGSARRAPFLADFNGISVDDSLPAGTLVTIPLTVVHTAVAQESLVEIAKAYFGDAKQAEMLRRYNFLDKRTLDKAESVIVPVYQVRLSAARQPVPDAASKTRRDHRRDATARVARALPTARQAWKDGDYAGVKTALGELGPDLDYLDAADASDVGVLLGAAYVAYSDDEHAIAAFKRVLDRQPHCVLKRYDWSPRVVALWEKSGGTAE